MKVKKLIKEKNDGAGISEYIDINKELQEVLPTTRLHMFVITQFFGVWTTSEGTRSRRLYTIIEEVASFGAYLDLSGGNIDGRNAFGLSALHLATWRNHLPIVRRLLDAGADPDARDGESGWSSLHRALHFGHLCIASVLLQFGASLALEDTKGRTPVDLISCPVSQANGDFPDAVATEVFSWGSGTNYQLGTGNVHIQKLPCKVEALHGSYIKTVAASKFHSVAVSSNGELYTWGFGRGGRLGHPDIHSGQTTAVITPRQVTVGLGRKRVSVVAAAKHHTVIATELGNCLPGDQIEGQLGYPSVHTQPTPRRVGSLKQRIISVAAANKHSTAVADTGEVLTCGCNKEGQLGYSTSNLASNCIPRMVEYLKGKVLRGVSAAKYHTIVLGADGEVSSDPDIKCQQLFGQRQSARQINPVVSHPNTSGDKDVTSDNKSQHESSELPPRAEFIVNKQMTVEGYKAHPGHVNYILGRAKRICDC
ncbi:ankyrin repeat family protein / regulator of chromosome condensation (RCC1) family protein [Zea mays]|uniref:Ankyrin repeat family protein / regulator of chromosome condensation (RCC1) family protein n=1 Tax=Zea mays TaxID=4577 RepID=A0A1D6Q9T4_MAIZE|nr:ankyrin repeat family protein / regulator of chromosome condensation (RCC1) family protein [Zea mays]